MAKAKKPAAVDEPADEPIADVPAIRPEVKAARLTGTAPNTPLEGPALAEFRPPTRSPNVWAPTLSGPALGPYRPPAGS